MHPRVSPLSDHLQQDVLFVESVHVAPLLLLVLVRVLSQQLLREEGVCQMQTLSPGADLLLLGLHLKAVLGDDLDVAQGFLNTLDSITPLLSVIHYNTNKIKHFTLHPSHTAKHHPHPSMLADDREMVFLSFFSYLLVGIIQN